MMHGFQQIVTQAERCDNFVVHGLPPLGDEMGVSPLIWRKKLMDSISGNLGYLRRFLQKNVLIQDVGVGLITMSYLGKFGSRFNRASTACIAALPSETPFWYILLLRATIGCIPFQVICLAHPSIVSASISFVPFHCN